MQVELDFSQIYDWSEFHDFFFHALGFSGDYEHHMDGWVESMKAIDDPLSGMTKVHVSVGESLEFLLIGSEMAMQNAPDIMMGFIESVALVNQFFMEQGTDTRIVIVPS